MEHLSGNRFQDTKFLVIVHQYDGDVEWAKRLKYPHVIYYKDSPDKEPFNAPNKAKAETNTLKFIYEFYDDLPENIISVYQYEYKNYHEGSLVHLLNPSDFSNFKNNFENNYYNSLTPGYFNFNITTMGALGNVNKNAMINSGWWKSTMYPFFGNIDDYGDFTNGKKNCAQFVVSRNRIRYQPREFYKNMFDWLVNNTLDQEMPKYDPISKCRISTPIDKNILSNWFTSRYMEWTWQLIFTAVQIEKISGIMIQNMNIKATYGFGSYEIDITINFIKRCFYFLDKPFIFIPRTLSFNSIFSDVVCEKCKTLKILISIGDKILKYNLPEVRDTDFSLEL